MEICIVGGAAGAATIPALLSGVPGFSYSSYSDIADAVAALLYSGPATILIHSSMRTDAAPYLEMLAYMKIAVSIVYFYYPGEAV